VQFIETNIVQVMNRM